MQLGAEPVEVVRAHLVDGDQNHQRRASCRRGSRCGLLRVRVDGGEKECGASQYQSIHGQQCELSAEFRQAMAHIVSANNYYPPLDTKAHA